MNAPVPNLNTAQVLSSVTKAWDEDLVGQLSDYIEIPAKSPAFDPNWQKAGYLDTVLQRAATWVEAQKVPGLKLEVLRLPGRTDEAVPTMAMRPTLRLRLSKHSKNKKLSILASLV